ncbi:hypothetical protein ACHAXR_004398 [Thalassiosira sp. AJA248-18]
MSCPLSALANIATMTAAPLQNGDSFPMLPPTASKNKPMKKRSVPTDADGAYAHEDLADHHRLTTGMPIKFKPKKSKRARTSKTNQDGQPKLSLHSSSTSSNHRRAAKMFKMKDNQPSFPVVLMGIMSAPQNKEYISFLSDQQSFIIVHAEALAENILPMHFEANVPTLDQFLYLLETWGFETIMEPQYPQVKVFKHPMFRKGDWEACLEMKLPAEEGKISKSNSPAHAPAPHPPSPRHLSIAAAVERQSPPMMARSVTPPDCSLSPGRVESAAPQWLMQSASLELEQLIKATAQTRCRLSGFKAMNSISASPSLEELSMNYLELKKMHHQVRISEASASIMSRNRGGTSLTSSYGQETRLTDAHVKLVTNDVVSAAVAALKNGNQQQHHANSPSPSISIESRLDAMTEAFLERSNARMKRSRPAGIYGKTQLTQLSDVVDAQTRAMLAQKRQQS